MSCNVSGVLDALNANGAKFYGAFWCPHCKKQKQTFGRAAVVAPFSSNDPLGDMNLWESIGDRLLTQDNIFVECNELFYGTGEEGSTDFDMVKVNRPKACEDVTGYPEWVLPNADGGSEDLHLGGEQSIESLGAHYGVAGC